MEKTNEIPRRNRIDLYSPAELAIRNAVLEIEKLQADVRLTNACDKLHEAKELVADFIDSNTVIDTLKPVSGFNVVSVWEDLDCVDPEPDEHTVVANFNTIEEALVKANEIYHPFGTAYIVASDGKRYNRLGREGHF